MSLPRPIRTGLYVGGVVGTVLFLLCFMTVFGISGDTTIAQVLFPFALASDPTLHDHALLAVAFAILQFPLYGIILGSVWAFASSRKGAFVVCVLLLTVSHGFVVRLAIRRVAAWQQQFNHVDYSTREDATEQIVGRERRERVS
jgi:cytochrome c biogenesis protein CcdA